MCDVSHPYSLYYDAAGTTFALPITPLDLQNESAQPEPNNENLGDSYFDANVPGDAHPSTVPASIIAESVRGTDANFVLRLKRPKNKFFLYKEDHINDPIYSNMRMADKLVHLAQRWHNEPASVKEVYTQQQIEIKESFVLANPNYKYEPKTKPKNAEKPKPQKKSKTEGKKRKNKGKYVVRDKK